MSHNEACNTTFEQSLQANVRYLGSDTTFRYLGSDTTFRYLGSDTTFRYLGSDTTFCVGTTNDVFTEAEAQTLNGTFRKGAKVPECARSGEGTRMRTFGTQMRTLRAP